MNDGNERPAVDDARGGPRISSIEIPGSAPRSRGLGLSRATRYAAVVIAILVFGMLGSWTHHAIEGSLRELRAASLTSVLDAEVKALEVWITEKQLSARRLARDGRFRSRVEELARLAQPAGAASGSYCRSDAAHALEEELDPLAHDEAIVAFHVIDRQGRIIAARPASACAAAQPEVMASRSAAALAGKTQFIRPLRDDARLAAARGSEPSPPMIWIQAPVEDRAGKVIAALALGEYADAGFGAILAAARTGRTGEAYAFDERGILLSASRFASPDAKEPLALTRLAEEALAPGSPARRGILLEPYKSYRGANVIGAWRWLPDYGMGVAVEIDADEAYAPLTFLNTAFAVVFGILVAAMSAALLYALWLRRQIGEARRLGAYVLERKIGEGGMADVYLAHHSLLRRPTAVKILRPERSSEQFVARFEREVKLASQLTHPNMVEIYDYGRTAEGQFYYAMEYLDGIELLELGNHGAVPVGRAIYLLRQVCAGLAEAHAKGLVHRDIKPENIMVCARGGEFDVIKILDFGLVKNVADPQTRDLTRAVKLLGTPLYMAPERFQNPGDVDARADIYAVGAVAFYLLTAREVFQANDDLELSNRILNEEAPRPSTVVEKAIPIELDLLVTSCLEKRREDRPQRVTDLVEAFDALAVAYRWTQREAADWWQHRGDQASKAAAQEGEPA